MKDNRMEDYWAEGDAQGDSADTTIKGTVVYHYPSGRKERVTANRPFRNHSPGNLKYRTKQDALDAGALAVDGDGFAVFPDWLSGKYAADAWWDGRRNEGLTIEQAVYGFTETEQELRIRDLLNKAKGYKDKNGNPVNRYTPLSKLSDDQFATLRNYNNVQLEGWINGIGTAHIEIIPAPDPIEGQTRTGPQQVPAGPVPAGPDRNHSYLDAPWATDPYASIGAGAPDAVGPMAHRNLLLSPDTPQSDLATWAHWPPQYASGNGPAGMGDPVSSHRVALAPANALDYPSWPVSFSPPGGNLLGPSTEPFREWYDKGYALAQAEKRQSGLPPEPKPFYSLRDRLDFLGDVYRVAKPVSDATGLSLPLILAHAAHETGWGRTSTATTSSTSRPRGVGKDRQSSRATQRTGPIPRTGRA